PAGQARKHIIYAINPKAGLGTMIAKREPISDAELARVEAAAAAAKFEIVVSPTSNPANPLARYLDAGAYSDTVASAVEELRAPTDDRPFFFYFKKLPQLLSPTWLMNDPGLWILISLGLVVALATAFVIAPLVIHRHRMTAAPGTRLPALGY